MSNILDSIRLAAGLHRDLEAIRGGVDCLFCGAALEPAMGKYGLTFVHDDGMAFCEAAEREPHEGIEPEREWARG